MILWATGFSGSGKSVYASYLSRHHKFVVLDGDELRADLSKDCAYDYPGREEHGRRIIALCKILDKQGRDVFVSTILGDNTGRAWVKREIGHSKIIWVKASIETCMERDPKGLYAKKLPYMVGVSTSWEDPIPPFLDLILDTENHDTTHNYRVLDAFINKERGWK